MKINEIQDFCSLSRIKWYKHALERMQERDISRTDVINCLMCGEIIEDYPDDFPHPSCLVWGYTISKKIIHVVVSIDSENVGIITAYFPSEEKFKDNFKTRKEP